MRTWWKIPGLLLLLLGVALPSEAMRMRGEPHPGLANINRHRSGQEEAAIQGRITGGTTAAAGSWPWMASIQNVYSYHLCGASIINERWLVTAASCLSGLRARNILVVTGTNDWWSLSAPYYLVDQIHVHCNFDKPLYHNDIALLHLTEDIVFDDLTQKITLADIDELQEGETLSFAGWGSPEAMGTYDRYLQESSGTYVPEEGAGSAWATPTMWIWAMSACRWTRARAPVMVTPADRSSIASSGWWDSEIGACPAVVGTR